MAHTRVVHGGCLLNEIENLRSGCPRSEDGANPNGVKCSAILIGTDATTEDDYILKPGLNEFGADLWKEVGVGAGERAPLCVFVFQNFEGAVLGFPRP